MPIFTRGYARQHLVPEYKFQAFKQKKGLIEQQRNNFDSLDKFTKSFKDSHLEFYDGYLSARDIRKY